MNEWEKLLALADEKAKAAKAIYAGENPDEKALETADGLLAEAEALRTRAEKVKAADTISGESAAAKAAREKAEAEAKAARARLESEPPVNGTGGFATTLPAQVKDHKDTPYKHIGEFLMDVADASRGATAEKLEPLRSHDPIDEGGFSLGKALGPKFIGNMYDAAVKRGKAISGMSEAVPQDGGTLVREDYAPGIMGRVYDVGKLLQMVDMMPVSNTSNSMVIFREKESSRADGSRRGGIRAYWASEGDLLTSSKPAFERHRLELAKVIGLVYATDELLGDAAALGAWVMANLPEELRFVIEDAIINGTGSGQPDGIVGADCTVSVEKETGQSATTIVAENVMKMWSRRWTRAQDYVWLAHQDTGPQLWSMYIAAGTGGVPIYMPPGGLSQSQYGTLYGRPVLESEYCQTLGTVGDLILMSLKEYQMIEKGGIQSASSIHVRFLYDEQVFRFVTRVDGAPKWASTLTPKNGTNTVSPFVTLATRS